jgi:hypothetical protein
MDDQELRALVRDTIQRHIEAPARESAGAARGTPHASHYIYVQLQNPSEACLIEPTVPCTHCHYCQSHGH